MPSDHDSKIVPFGKYQGRSVEELVADDSYVRWLTAQDWFRTRHATLYQIVINKGAEPTETPEHNAIQVRFLDDAFCVALVESVVGTCSSYALELRWSNSDKIDARIDGLKNRSYDAAKHEWQKEQQEKERARDKQNIAALRDLRKQLDKPFSDLTANIERRFEERGVDVILRGSIGYASHTGLKVPDSFWDHFHLHIEIKPTVGDDYPAVLRQMRANGSGVLLLAQYTGVGATYKQLVQTFATAGIRVVTLTAVEARLAAKERREGEGAQTKGPA